MNARDRILSRVKLHQPAFRKTEAYASAPVKDVNCVEQFTEAVIAIGGAVIETQRIQDVSQRVKAALPNARNIFIGLGENQIQNAENMNSLADLQVAVLCGEFGVAENGAVWISDKNIPDRALPFICEHLVLVIARSRIVVNLHEAYKRIEHSGYEYGTFIAGPSKTADIEQSLVLGAHGPKSMTVYLIQDEADQ